MSGTGGPGGGGFEGGRGGPAEGVLPLRRGIHLMSGTVGPGRGAPGCCSGSSSGVRSTSLRQSRGPSRSSGSRGPSS